MKKLSESIWSDMQDRSVGDVVRKEDDINLLDSDELYDYLNNHYKGIVPYALILNTYGILSVPIIRDVTNMCIMYNPESKMNAISIPSEIVTNVDGLLNLLHDNFLVKEMNGIYLISPKKLSKITNKFFIDVIDFLLENIPESPNYRKSIKKIEINHK